jgi:hypothetical protein
MLSNLQDGLIDLYEQLYKILNEILPTVNVRDVFTLTLFEYQTSDPPRFKLRVQWRQADQVIDHNTEFSANSEEDLGLKIGAALSEAVKLYKSKNHSESEKENHDHY